MPGFFDPLPPTNLNRDHDRIWLDGQTFDPMRIRPGWQTWAVSTANITEGGGAIVARYIQMGKLVVLHFSFTLAAGSAMGSAPAISLPVEASDTYKDFEQIGEATMRDINGSIHEGSLRLNNTSRTQGTITVGGASGATVVNTGVTATVPFTWTTGDYLMVKAQYESA